MKRLTYDEFRSFLAHARKYGNTGTLVLDLKRNLCMVVDGWLHAYDLPIYCNDNLTRYS